MSCACVCNVFLFAFFGNAFFGNAFFVSVFFFAFFVSVFFAFFVSVFFAFFGNAFFFVFFEASVCCVLWKPGVEEHTCKGGESFW